MLAIEEVEARMQKTHHKVDALQLQRIREQRLSRWLHITLQLQRSPKGTERLQEIQNRLVVRYRSRSIHCHLPRLVVERASSAASAATAAAVAACVWAPHRS